MTRSSALRNGLACAALLLAASSHGLAQSPARPATAQGAEAAGAVIVPPVSDPGMVRQAPPMPGATVVKPPPMEVDPKAVRKPRKDEPGGIEGGGAEGDARPDAGKHAPQGRQGAGRPDSPDDRNNVPVAVRPTTKDACKGPADLCRQDSAR